jgi:hypothetical protein
MAMVWVVEVLFDKGIVACNSNIEYVLKKYVFRKVKCNKNNNNKPG